MVAMVLYILEAYTTNKQKMTPFIIDVHKNQFDSTVNRRGMGLSISFKDMFETDVKQCPIPFWKNPRDSKCSFLQS